MAFCEECGASLTPEMKFCESCGAVVPADAFGDKGSISAAAAGVDLNIFSDDNWVTSWMKNVSAGGDADIGILLTREDALAQQIGVGRGDLHNILSAYVAAMRKRGVFYYYLDLDHCSFYNGNGDADSVVQALRTVVDVARPKYLFIVGNEDIIDVARWENQACDSDSEVESDLCYVTLDVNSPWHGQKYNFDDVLRVGRFPTSAGETIDQFSRYFNAVVQYDDTTHGLVPYGLSALVWEDESNDEYRVVSRTDVDVSPAVTKDTVAGQIPDGANLLFFNLHGSNDTKYWYGQEDHSYPEAFEPSVLNGRTIPYFIGVEACYGARYIGGIPVNESVVMTALRNNCLSFLGSSKIAFGTSHPKGSCADLVIGEYIKCLPKGYSAGDAYIEGLKALAKDAASMDDSDVKTLAEFALYGDPAVHMNRQESRGFVKGIFNRAGAPKGLAIPMPDVHRAVSMAIAEVDAKIEAIVDEYFARNVLPQLALDETAVDQSVYKMANTGLNQKIYSANANGMPRVAKIYFDDRGTIKKVLVSK